MAISFLLFTTKTMPHTPTKPTRGERFRFANVRGKKRICHGSALIFTAVDGVLKTKQNNNNDKKEHARARSHTHTHTQNIRQVHRSHTNHHILKSTCEMFHNHKLCKRFAGRRMASGEEGCGRVVTEQRTWNGKAAHFNSTLGSQ